MRQEPLKKQWRILVPSQPLDEQSCKQAFDWGYQAVVVEKDETVAPLKPIRKVVSPVIPPFDPEFMEFLSSLPHGVPLFWESALFKWDFKEELLKRALLPAELYVQEIELIAEKLAGQPLFYHLPHHFSGRHLDFLIQRTPLNVYFVHSSVLGEPERLDLPPHPFMNKEDLRLIPLYQADPLAPIEASGYLEKPVRESFCIAFNGSISSVEHRLKQMTGLEPLEGYSFDSRLCYLKAVASGKENPPLEEMRLLADLLIAEMRYEEKKGIQKDQEPKKRLLIQALEKMRLPVPLSLSLE